MPEAERAAADALIADSQQKWLWVPNPGPQTDAYFSEADELLYSGTAGGGKSDLLLGLAINEHDVTQLFRLQHNDRVALVRRLGEILDGVPGKPRGYNGSDHTFTRQIAGKHRTIEFGAMGTPGAWEHYQGRPASLKAWDEITQFVREGYVTVNGWLRSVNKEQRCRIVAAGNPPVTPEGLWVIEYWAPWLDPRHPKPAKPGELRYFTTIAGEDVEVDAGWYEVDKQGIIIKPRSRTFIRATLADNPDLAETNYGSALAALPKGLREAMYEGKFEASLEDDAMQVIPTEWILAAQQRWEHRKNEPRGPMTCVGIDPNGGGKDEFGIQRLYGTFFDEPILETSVDFKNPRVGAALVFKHITDDPQLNVDCTGGWGNGIVEHFESMGHDVRALQMAATSTKRARGKVLFTFANKRAEYIWGLREALDPENMEMIALPPGRRVVAELASPRYLLRGRNEILIEPKDAIIARLGRSPTILDSMAYAWAEAGLVREGGHPRRKERRRSTRSPVAEGAYDRARARYS